MRRLISSGADTGLLTAASLLTAIAAIGLAATPAQAQDDDADTGSSRIRLVNINGYSVLDNEHLVLNGGVSHHYLVTLRSRCSGLRSGIQVGTSFPSTATLHSPSMEYITIANDPLQQRCFIDTIEEVESVDAARALVADRDAADSGDDASGDGTSSQR